MRQTDLSAESVKERRGDRHRQKAEWVDGVGSEGKLVKSTFIDKKNMVKTTTNVCT